MSDTGLLDTLSEEVETEVEPSPPPRETETDADGWIYDLRTGEVLGKADITERFAVDSVESAEWVLELRSKITGDLAGIVARRKALLAQLDALHRDKLRQLSWWDWRFSSSLVAFARSALSGKSRTARFAWGKVSFRKSQGTHQILDMDQAVAWVRDWAPERIKVKESVTIKDVLATMDVVSRATGEASERPSFLAATDPEEHATIETGIEVETSR